MNFYCCQMPLRQKHISLNICLLCSTCLLNSGQQLAKCLRGKCFSARLSEVAWNTLRLNASQNPKTGFSPTSKEAWETSFQVMDDFEKRFLCPETESSVASPFNFKSVHLYLFVARTTVWRNDDWRNVPNALHLKCSYLNSHLVVLHLIPTGMEALPTRCNRTRN